MLGLVDNERYVELLDIWAKGKHGEIFGFVERLLDEGYDLVEFYHGLVNSLRAPPEDLFGRNSSGSGCRYAWALFKARTRSVQPGGPDSDAGIGLRRGEFWKPQAEPKSAGSAGDAAASHKLCGSDDRAGRVARRSRWEPPTGGCAA